jgi:hypothetical protein
MAARKVVNKTNGSAPKANGSTPKAMRKALGLRASRTNGNSKLDLASAINVLNQEQTRTELATAAVVAAVAALIKAELLPGILIGVSAMMVAKLFPGITDEIRPLLKSTLGMGYKAMGNTQKLIAEASDRAQDMLAEIKAEAGKSIRAATKPSAAIKPSLN